MQDARSGLLSINRRLYTIMGRISHHTFSPTIARGMRWAATLAVRRARCEMASSSGELRKEHSEHKRKGMAGEMVLQIYRRRCSRP
jgi:hypothetical protein